MPKTKEITVGDKKFEIENPGVRWSLDHDYNCRDRNGNIKNTDFVEGLLENVVVEPAGFTLEDFESLDEAMEFQQKIRNFL